MLIGSATIATAILLSTLLTAVGTRFVGMESSVEDCDALIRSGARRRTVFQRRLIRAEVATELCGESGFAR